MRRAQNTVKQDVFWRGGVVGGRGRGPSLLRRGENRRSAMPRPGGPWPDLSAYARQPARGPTMWAHFVAMLAYVGLCWSILRAMWAYLVAMLAYVGLRLIHVEPKAPAKKHCKTQDILMVGGLSWGYVGPSWGYVGPSWGLCCPSSRLCGPILGLCWPILGLCWPIFGAMLPHLGAMLAHLGAMLAHLRGHVATSWGYVGPS